MGGGWEKFAPGIGDLPFKGDTVIGNDVWIGQNVTVMPGVHIGDGAIIGADDLYDSTGEKGTLKGSILATLQKKLVVNTANVLFDLLGKTGSRQAINAAGDYLSAALYQLLRQLYRRCGGNEDFFAVSAGDFDAGLAAADMQRSAVHYLRALGEAEKLPEVTAESITTGYPGLGQSVAQVFHNTDERCKTL